MNTRDYKYYSKGMGKMLNIVFEMFNQIIAERSVDTNYFNWEKKFLLSKYYKIKRLGTIKSSIKNDNTNR